MLIIEISSLKRNDTFGNIEDHVKDSLDSKTIGRRNAGNTGFVINCERAGIQWINTLHIPLINLLAIF